MTSTLEKIMEKLRRKPDGVAGLRDARGAVDIAALGERVRSAEAELRDALLTGSARAIDVAEAAVAAARRDRDRGASIVDALDAKIVEAERAEATARLEADRAALVREASAAVHDVRRQYSEGSRLVVEALEKMLDLDVRVAEMNSALAAAGRHDDGLQRVEDRAFPRNIDGATLRPVVEMTELRPMRGAPGFGSPRDTFRVLGLEPC